MIILANFLYALAVLLNMVLSFVFMLVIARAVISWVNPDPYNPIVRFLTSSTDPLIEPIQRKLPLSANGMDFTPIVLIFIIYFLKAFLVQTMMDYSLVIKKQAISEVFNFIVTKVV